MAGEGATQEQVVLVVDDEKDIRDSLADIIETCIAGCRVITAASGEEGLKTLQESPIDLIVTDYRMGGMNGIEFLVEAQRIAPRAPRIMITAYPDIDLVVKAINEGQIINFLPKPFRGENVVQVVADALRERSDEISRRKALVAALNAMRRQTDP